MYVIVAISQVKPEYRQALIDAITEDAAASVKNEPGCLRFDVIQDAQDPNRIGWYEVYKNEAAFDAHRATPHLAKFRATLKDDWFVTPRTVIRGANLFPSDKEWK